MRETEDGQAGARSVRSTGQVARWSRFPLTFEARLRAKDGRPGRRPAHRHAHLARRQDRATSSSLESLSAPEGHGRPRSTRHGASSRTCPTRSALGVFRSTWGRKAALHRSEPGHAHHPSAAPRSRSGRARLAGAHRRSRGARRLSSRRLSRDKVVQDYRLGLRSATTAAASTCRSSRSSSTDESGQLVVLRRHHRGHHRAERRARRSARRSSPSYRPRSSSCGADHPGHHPRPLPRHERDRRAGGHADDQEPGRSGLRHRSRRRREVIGIVTDHDFRERVVSAGRRPETPRPLDHERSCGHDRRPTPPSTRRCCGCRSATSTTSPSWTKPGKLAGADPPARPGPLPAVVLGDHHRLDPPGTVGRRHRRGARPSAGVW